MTEACEAGHRGGLKAHVRPLWRMLPRLAAAIVLVACASMLAPSAAWSQDWSISISGSPNPVLRGQNITFTINVISNLAQNASGTLTINLPSNLTFVSGDAFGLGAGSCTLPAVGTSGTIICPTGVVGPTPAGHVFTWQYVLNSTNDSATTRVLTANWTASTNASATATIGVGAPTSTTLTSSPNPSTFGQAVTFAATVTGSGGTPSGTVTFKEGATTLGTGTLSGSGVATLTIPMLSVGSHSITAAYGGDSNFFGSTSSALNQIVNTGLTSTTLSSSPNPSTFGEVVTFTATVTGPAVPRPAA